MILRPDWLVHRVVLPDFGFLRLRLYRPSTIDLLLTKMMRIDPQDRADMEFLLKQPDCDADDLAAALDIAIVPSVAEIEEAYAGNRQWLLPRLQKRAS